MIDGRENVTGNMLALANAGEQSVDEMDHEHRGVPGDQYNICLAIAGKWRTVTWSKIKAGNPNDLASTSLGKYYVTGNWNSWTLEEMMPDSSVAGLFSIEVQLQYGGGLFKIIRDMDWCQVLYPASNRAGPAAGILGPNDPHDENCWFIESKPMEKYKICFQRSFENGKDIKKVTWQKVGN